ncbi:hypothetical protein [Leucothrix arctica]|uniref:Transposase InsH N-terminal domain-containing protein n=1 Tax=Leucothrix arctica TaxID=1481894 RepID=A0A317C722_9GAMM|nr:hypothetical protein [Leucothrix arctica]PWQ94097.1 hypothetical protein DKT75_16285 [Leucothrix arctica]
MILDQNHQLYKFHQSVDWDYVASKLNRFSDNSEKNCFIAALFYLRTMQDCSSEEAIKQWGECPYWRYFCGGESAVAMKDFPYSPYLLDIWAREMDEEAVDVMVNALLRPALSKTLLH